MDVLYPVCAGLDVHKKLVVACVCSSDAGDHLRKEIHTFSTMTVDILALAAWLTACGLTHVAMESTGEYWKRIYQLLEGSFTLLVVNAQHIKAVPGRKTDFATPSGLPTCFATGCCRRASFPHKPNVTCAI
jgi:transposase